jgi:hypothetical protein
MDVPEPAIDVGARVQVSPVGETDAVRLTVPEKPLRAVTVMVELPGDPAGIVKLFGLEEMAKS